MRILTPRDNSLRIFPSSFDIILFGDSHEGAVAKSRHGYRQCLGYILDGPDRFGVHMGDESEYFWIDDPRYMPDTCESTPVQQLKANEGELRPLVEADKLIGILNGNHNRSLTRQAGNMTKALCENLSPDHDLYLTWTTVLDLHDVFGPLFKVYLTHGRKTISSYADDPERVQSNERLILKRQLKNMMGDCLLMAKGHAHKLIVSKPVNQLFITTRADGFHDNYVGPGSSDRWIHPDLRWYACTGSFLRTFHVGVETYSEVGEYPPVQLGYIIAEVRDRQLVDVRPVFLSSGD